LIPSHDREHSPMTPLAPTVAAERRALAERLHALAERMEADPAAAQEPLAREAYRLRRLNQEVVAGLADRWLAEVPADPSPTRHWCGGSRSLSTRRVFSTPNGAGSTRARRPTPQRGTRRLSGRAGARVRKGRPADAVGRTLPFRIEQYKLWLFHCLGDCVAPWLPSGKGRFPKPASGPDLAAPAGDRARVA
jgi:hypothetical protein